MPLWLIIIPIVSALVGCLLHFLFSRYLLNVYLPSREQQVAHKISSIAAGYITSGFNLKEKIGDPTLIEKAMPAIEKHIDEFLNVKLKEEIPMLGMFVGNKTTDKIKEVFINQLRLLFPQVMIQITDNLQNDLNVQAIIENKLQQNHFFLMAKQAAQPQINRYILTGVLFGFIIGLLNAVIVYIFLR